jgi:outer membrane protein OmpA-like peptidoglycan-associated protein
MFSRAQQAEGASPWEGAQQDTTQQGDHGKTQHETVEGTDTKTGSRSAGDFSTYEALSQWLEDVYGRIGRPSMSSGAHALYAQARAHIAASKEACAQAKQTDRECRMAFATCSLYTVAAVTRLEIEQAHNTIDTLGRQYRRIVENLQHVRERIDSIEKSNTAQLKQKLEEQKAKTEQLKEKARQKFEKLQGELVSVTQDARGTIISMADILFEFGSARLKERLKLTLAKVAGILNIFKEYHVTIEGHTDNVGSLAYNQKLSEKRAQNVLDFLVEQGIDSTRLRAVGYGPSRPIADNSTEEGRQKNRRVDLVVHQQDSAQLDAVDFEE